VESVSSEAGSLAGGHVLQVRGKGFGNAADAVRVDVAGIPCHVLSATDAVITCLTSPWDPSVRNYTSFPGGAGVNLTTYTGVLCPVLLPWSSITSLTCSGSSD
jgi:hypothetical protein